MDIPKAKIITEKLEPKISGLFLNSVRRGKNIAELIRDNE